MLESNEDKINDKKTTQSKEDATELTNKVDISESIIEGVDGQELEVEHEVTKATNTEIVTDELKASDTQEKVIIEKVEKSQDADIVLKENPDKVEKNTEQEKPNKEVEAIAYDTLTLEELTVALENLIHTQKIQHIKSSVEAIKSAFNLKFGALLAEKKSVFLAEGGNTIDFQYSSPIKSKYNKLLSDYKKQKEIYYSNLEKQLKDNLEKRVQVIEDLKVLIENADTSTMYKHFRDLQNSWRLIGPVPKTKYNDTWKIYHHHVERFYDLLHLSNDFRDLDFKNNLEEKLKLIEKAEWTNQSCRIHFGKIKG